MRPQFVAGDPIATLRNCRGYYMRPKDADGNWAGPLVGYAKRYGPDKKQMVGNLYLDCARLERFPWILNEYAKMLAEEIRDSFRSFDWVMGVPEGGKTLAALIALHLGCEYIYPEKGQTDGDMVAKRHKINPSTKGFIIEDVCHNFSTTDKVLRLIERAGAEAIGIVCIFNRSGKQVYHLGREALPVWWVSEVAAEQFEQEDPAVADDIFVGDVIWDPKAEIGRLVTKMQAAEARLNAPETGN